MIARPRGRPRRYDPDTALSDALAAFWKTGYSGTSLDRLSDATGMNRPSLYGAFGDKKSIYLKALARFAGDFGRELFDALNGSGPLTADIEACFRRAIDTYADDPDNPKGCFAVCTAAVEAPADVDIKGALSDVLGRIDAAFEARLVRAKAEGDLPPDADPAVLAKLCGAVLHSLAIRARAGTPRAALAEMARGAADLLRRPAS